MIMFLDMVAIPMHGQTMKEYDYIYFNQLNFGHSVCRI